MSERTDGSGNANTSSEQEASNELRCTVEEFKQKTVSELGWSIDHTWICHCLNSNPPDEMRDPLHALASMIQRNRFNPATLEKFTVSDLLIIHRQLDNTSIGASFAGLSKIARTEMRRVLGLEE